MRRPGDDEPNPGAMARTGPRPDRALGGSLWLGPSPASPSADPSVGYGDRGQLSQGVES
jgi:hypothetical protein